MSTKKQAEKGLSLPVQREKIEAFAALHGLDLVGVIEDGGKSAESLDRPGIKEVLRRLDSGEVQGLVVAKLDRLTRLVRDWACLVEDRFGRKGGPTLHSVSEYFDLRTPNGRFFGNLIISFSQCELETGVQRSESVMGDKRVKGEQLGNVPYGKRLDADGKTLIDDADELDALHAMVILRADGLKLRDIAREMDLGEYRPRSGRKWAISTISKLLAEVRCHSIT